MLAALTTLALSLGFVPSVGAQTTTCGAPDLAGRVEVWRATLTVEELIVGPFSEGYGYHPTHGGTLSPSSFELDSHTVTVTVLRNRNFTSGAAIEIEFDVDISLLPTLPSLRFHFCDRALDISDGTQNLNKFQWPAARDEWATTSSIEVVLSKAANTSATGYPSVTGTPELRSELSATTGSISDANGLDNATYDYQWVRIDGTTEFDIPDATDQTYVATSDDIGKSLKVVMSFTDDDGYEEDQASLPVGPVTALSCPAPDIGNRVEVWRATLTVEELIVGPFSEGYGYHPTHGGTLSPPSFELDSHTVTVTILRNRNFTSDAVIEIGFDVDISLLPTLPSLRFHFCDRALDISDGTQNLNKFEWPAARDEWSSATTIEVALSAPRPPNNLATGTPTITGTPKVGETLTASTADISDDDGKPSVFEYQWVRMKRLEPYQYRCRPAHLHGQGRR